MTDKLEITESGQLKIKVFLTYFSLI